MKKYLEQYNINEAFMALEDLPEEVLETKTKFKLSDEEELDDLKSLILVDEVGEKDPVEMVIDIDAETEEDLKDTYIGDVILSCKACKSLVYKPEDLLVKDEKEDADGLEVYNIEEACPHCHSILGYDLVGKVAPFDKEESEELQSEDEAGEDIADDEDKVFVNNDEVDESYDERLNEDLRWNVVSFPNGEYFYYEVRGDKMVAGTATNVGIIPEFEIEYDHDIPRDSNIENLYNHMVEQRPELLDESCKKKLKESKDLPDKLRINIELDGDTDEEIEEYISDYLSNVYGFTHNGFKWEMLKPSGDILVTDIEWDLDESCKKLKESLTEASKDVFVVKRKTIENGKEKIIEVDRVDNSDLAQKMADEIDGAWVEKAKEEDKDESLAEDYSYKITNGDITDTVTQTGEYTFTIKHDKGGRYVRAIDKLAGGNTLTKFLTSDQVEGYKKANNMWVVDESLSESKGENKPSSIEEECKDESLNESLARYADTDAQEEILRFIEKCADEVGIKLRAGTKVGKYPQTVILDYNYQDGAVTVHSNGSFEIGAEEFGSWKEGDYEADDFNDDDVKVALQSLSEEEIEESCDKDKTLTEKQWDLTLESGKELRDAIKAEDGNLIKEKLKDCWKEINSKRPDLLDEEELENTLEDIDIADFVENSEVGVSSNDAIDNIDYYLDDLYDFCDNTNIWVELDEKLSKKCEECDNKANKNLTEDKNDLPDMCYVDIKTGGIGIIKNGESGYYKTDLAETNNVSGKEKEELVDTLNKKLGVSRAQAKAMEVGSMFGWNVPGADPSRYEGRFNENKKCPEDKKELDECDVKIEEIDEKLFDTLVNNYLKEVYNNVESFETTGGSVDNKENKLVIEGKINFKSGRSQDTKFIFSEAKITKKGKIKMKGLNETLAKMKKAFTLQGTLKNNAFISESFTYNYKVNDGTEVRRLYGTEKNITEDLKLIADIGDYNPWSGAIPTFERIQDEGKIPQLEQLLEDTYPEGLTMTELNDLLWFDGDQVLAWLGIIDEEEVDESCEKKNEELKNDPELKDEVNDIVSDLLDTSVYAANKGLTKTADKLLDVADELAEEEQINEDVNSVTINQGQPDEIKLEANDINEITVSGNGGNTTITISQPEDLEAMEIEEPFLGDVEAELEAEFGAPSSTESHEVEMIVPTEEDEPIVSDEEVNAELETEFNKE